MQRLLTVTSVLALSAFGAAAQAEAAGPGEHHKGAMERSEHAATPSPASRTVPRLAR
jgi:hypothetical protein